MKIIQLNPNSSKEILDEIRNENEARPKNTYGHIIAVNNYICTHMSETDSAEKMLEAIKEMNSPYNAVLAFNFGLLCENIKEQEFVFTFYSNLMLLAELDSKDYPLFFSNIFFKVIQILNKLKKPEDGLIGLEMLLKDIKMSKDIAAVWNEKAISLSIQGKTDDALAAYDESKKAPIKNSMSLPYLIIKEGSGLDKLITK